MRTRAASDAGTTERGFTLVELLIALLVLAIVMVALAPAFYGNMRAASATNYRSTATGLAVAAIEQMRGFPYYSVGYSSSANDPQLCQTNNPNPTQDPAVENVPSRYAILDPANAPRHNLYNGPLNPYTPPGGVIPYTITRCIYWVPASPGTITGGVQAPTYLGAYKQTLVWVQWKVGGLSWQVSETSAIYPGGEGTYSTNGANSNGIPFSSNCQNPAGTLPVAPLALTATPDSTFPATAVDLTWTEGSGDSPSVLPLLYEVDYQSTGSNQWVFYQDTGDPGTVNIPFVVDGLIPSTAYSFEVYEVSCDGRHSPTAPTATATTGFTTTTGCSAYNFTVSPATGATIDSTGSLTGSPNYFLVSVQVTTGCSQVAVQYSPTNNGQYTTDVYSGAATSGTLTWQTTALKWAEGTTTFALYIAGASTGESQSVTIACAPGKTC
jgi:prepilin-type N-terminal cleavage/methylation domain-containing protein